METYAQNANRSNLDFSSANQSQHIAQDQPHNFDLVVSNASALVDDFTCYESLNYADLISVNISSKMKS